MSIDPQMRASDRDRDRAAELLREHHAAGRLDPQEFDERLDKVFTAKTLAELDELTADLPAIDLYPLPTASLPRSRPVSTDLPATSVLSQAANTIEHLPGPWPIAWGGWAVLAVICGLVWLISGSFWPLALAAAGGALLAGTWAVRNARRSGGSGA